MTSLPGTKGYTVTQTSRFDAERLAAYLAPWDDAETARGIAEAQGLASDDETIAAARAMLKRAHVVNLPCKEEAP